jgi:hypothetical protein
MRTHTASPRRPPWLVQTLDKLQAAALLEADALGQLGPAHKAWVDEVSLMQDYLNFAARTAAEAGHSPHMLAVLGSRQAQRLAVEDDGGPFNARGWVEGRTSASLSAMLGAIRGGHLEDMPWSCGGLNDHEIFIWLAQTQQCDGMAWGDSLHALLGGRVCGGTCPRPPAEGQEAFAPLCRVLSLCGDNSWGLNLVIGTCGADPSFFARVEDGDLMAWVEAQGHPRAWAGRVRDSIAHRLLSRAGGADALRAAVSWLVIADWHFEVEEVD